MFAWIDSDSELVPTKGWRSVRSWLHGPAVTSLTVSLARVDADKSVKPLSGWSEGFPLQGTMDPSGRKDSKGVYKYIYIYILV